MDTNLQNLDLSSLDNLTPEEKAQVFSILKEYATSGQSQSLNNLIYEDYEEIPVDILTFVDDYNYLGNAWHDSEGNSKLYPYWRKELLKIFPDNITTKVNNAIFSGSRGRGKSEVASLIMAYLLHRILCLKDPVGHFHLKPTEKIVFAFMNIKLALAEEIGIAKFQNTIQSSPWFMAHGTLEGRTRKVWVPQKYNGQEAIDIKIGSQSDDLIGLPVYACFFDEISFIKNQDVEKQKQKAYDMIDTALGGMKTRFIHNGKNPTLLMLASSKRSDKSFLEEHMKKKIESEKDNVYISDGPVWEVKPKGTYSDQTFKIALGNKFLQSMILKDTDDADEFLKKGYQIIEAPIDFRPDFIDDIDRALCDFAGISSSSITKYISGAAVSSIITNRIQNPFLKEILEIGNGPDDLAQYYDFFDKSKIDPALKSKPLFIHLDMSISGDMTGIAGVFIRGKKINTSGLDQANDLFYSLAFSVNIKAPKGRQISFEKNRNFIYWLKQQGFNIKGISSDTFQSYDTGEALRAKGYPYEVLSVDRVDTNKICQPYQYFRSAIYENRFEMYDDKVLIPEITDLERNMNTGKIDHPTGGCFTGETEVALVDGRSLSFLGLVDEYNKGKDNYVYSINLATQKVEPKRIVKAWKTRQNAQLVKITFDNGKSVKCTPDHRFMLRNGSYLEAEKLIPGDSLMPLYTKYPSSGNLKDYRMYYEPFENSWHYEHRQFATEILDDKYLVHHKDCNKHNNNPTNLIWMSKEAHQAIHSNNGTGAYSADALIKKSDSIKAWHEKNRGTEGYQLRADKTSKSLLKHNFEKYGHNATLDYKDHIQEIEKTFGVDWNSLSQSEKDSYGVKLSRIKDPTIKIRAAEKTSQKHAEGAFINAKNALAAANKKSAELKKLFPTIDKELFLELFGFDFDSLGSYQRAPWTNRYRQRLYDLKNHKIIQIEFLDETADVYDIEVEDNHNFALAAGVFVHNSKDVCDAVCGATYIASKHAEEFAYDYGEQAETILMLNAPSELAEDRQSIAAAMEEELKAMHPLRVHPSDANLGTTDYTMYGDFIIL